MHGRRGLNRAERELLEARKWFKSEVNLRGLDLAQIPASVFCAPLTGNIIKLDLSHNSLVHLPACVKCLVKLQTLLLGHNSLVNLPSELCGLYQLITLDVSHNNLDQIPSCLSHLSRLENINFSGNEIREFAPQILRLRWLKRLYVTKNPIENVPKDVCLSGLSALRNYFNTCITDEDINLVSCHFADICIENKPFKLQRINDDVFSNSGSRIFTSDYGSCSLGDRGSVDLLNECYDDGTCSCYGDHGSESDADFDTDYDLSPRSEDESDSDSDVDLYVERILEDRTKLIQYRDVCVQIPEHNKSNYRRDQFHMTVQEDFFYTPVLSERSVHAGVVLSLTPHGAQFYETEPALIRLPIGVSVSCSSEVVCLCSDTTLGDIPDWQPLPRSNYYLHSTGDTVTIKAYHFSLYTVVATRSYPEVTQPIVAAEGGTIEVNEVPGVSVTFPKGSLTQDIDAKVQVFFGDEPYSIDTCHEEPRALATPVVMLGPHGCQFKSEHPVTVQLPLPDCQEIINRFKLNPKAKLSIWHSSTGGEDELDWERYDGKFDVEKSDNGTYSISFQVLHFSWYKAVWDILAHTLHGCKVGVSYFYPYIRFSMMCQAMMEENPDTKSFGLEVICFRSDKKLPEMGNYKHRVGGSTKPKMVRPGAICVRLASNDFQADVLHGEDESLTKIEHDFRGMEFEKQFACIFKDNPVEKGVFGKVFVERIVTSDFKQAIFEFNLTKHGGEAEMNLESTDRWSLLAVRELASMLNITSDNNWKVFAKELGFTNHEIKNQLCSTNDPFAFMLCKYQSRGGTPDEFVQCLYKVGRQLRIDTGGKLDQIGFAQKFSQMGLRFSDDDDSVSESSAMAGPSGSGGRTPPRKRGSKASEGTSSSKRRRRNSDPDQSDMSSGEFSPTKGKKPATITSDSAHRVNDEAVTDQVLWLIAPHINQKWKAVGRTLGVPEEALVCISHENRDVNECTFQMLFKWKTMHPKESNYGVLYTALCSNALNSVASTYCTGPGTSS